MCPLYFVCWGLATVKCLLRFGDIVCAFFKVCERDCRVGVEWCLDVK